MSTLREEVLIDAALLSFDEYGHGNLFKICKAIGDKRFWASVDGSTYSDDSMELWLAMGCVLKRYSTTGLSILNLNGMARRKYLIEAQTQTTKQKG